MNCVGVITLDPFYWYQTAKPNVTLDHINNYTDIEEAIKNNQKEDEADLLLNEDGNLSDEDLIGDLEA